MRLIFKNLTSKKYIFPLNLIFLHNEEVEVKIQVIELNNFDLSEVIEILRKVGLEVSWKSLKAQ